MNWVLDISKNSRIARGIIKQNLQIYNDRYKRYDMLQREFDAEYREAYRNGNYIYVVKETLSMMCEKEKVEAQKHIKRLTYYLYAHKKKGGVTNEQITLAKEYKIGELLTIEPKIKHPNRWMYCCPLHQEKTPSFVWYKQSNTWYCFGACKQGGDVIELFQKLYNKDFITSINALT